MALDPVKLGIILHDLTHHVGWIHQGQVLSRRGDNITIRNLDQIGVGRRPCIRRDINTSMGRCPESERPILIDICGGFSFGAIQHALLVNVIIPQ